MVSGRSNLVLITLSVEVWFSHPNELRGGGNIISVMMCVTAVTCLDNYVSDSGCCSCGGHRGC